MSAMEAFRLIGRVAAVTGGGRGLGASAAAALADAGAHVVLIGRDLSRLDQAVEGILAAGGSAEAVQLDVADSDGVRRAFAAMAGRHGHVDVLVNNAGVASEAPVREVTDQDWDSVVDVNLRGTFVCSQAFAALQPAHADRAIVNVASLAAHVGVRNQAPYVASKGGVLSLTRALALELARDGIRVNAISPGYFRTDMPGEVLASAAASENLLRKVPMRRWGEPEEIGPAVLYLASPASSFVTGTVLNLDGGYTAQ